MKFGGGKVEGSKVLAAPILRRGSGGGCTSGFSGSYRINDVAHRYKNSDLFLVAGDYVVIIKL